MDGEGGDLGDSPVRRDAKGDEEEEGEEAEETLAQSGG